MPIAIFVLLLILYAAIRRVPVFSAFVQGASDALPLLLKLLPTLAAFSMALRLFADSGAQTLLTDALAPVCAALGVDARLLPLLAMRPFSGSAAHAVLLDLYGRFGADAPVSLRASVLLGSSETVFYTVALYFGAVGVKRTRFCIPVALVSMLVSVVSGLLLCTVFFGAD